MKKLILGFLLISSVGYAQTMGVKDIPVEGETTIEIKKGSSSKHEFQVVTSEDEIEGDSAVLVKDARISWKKACADWKVELKELNKENQILTMNCGKMKCAQEGVEFVCSSTTKAKIKTRIKQASDAVSAGREFKI